MAPQQELEKLIPNPRKEGQYGGYSTDEVASLTGEDAHVVIVQPEEARTGGENKSGSNNNHGKKGRKQRGSEEPQNCRQLETVLFFFGIAGMIVSLVMLLQHFIMKYVPYS